MTTATQTTLITDDEWALFSERLRSDLVQQRQLTADPERLVLLGDTAPEFLSVFGVSASLAEAKDDLSKVPPLDTSGLPHDVADAIKSDGQSVHSTLEQARAEVEQRAEAMKSHGKPTPDDWNQQMISLRDETKQKLDEKVDKAFQRIIDRGNQHPGEREVLGKVAAGLSGFFTTLGELVLRAFQWLADKLEWLWERIKEGARWVWDRLVDVGNAVKHFFGL